MLRHLGAAGVLTLALASGALGAWPDDWPYLRSEEGWFFYQEPPPPPKPTPTPELPQPPEPPREETASVPRPPDALEKALPSEIPQAGPALEAWLLKLPDTDLQELAPKASAAALRAWAPILMDQALTLLHRSSVRKYLLVQQEVLRRSDRFSRIWQEVIWTDPTFDRPDAMPMGSVAQALYEEQRTRQEQATLDGLRDSVSLLLAVQADCPVCETQWQILSNWATRYHFSVRPIARSLTTLPDSTIALPYPEILTALQVQEYPSLFLIQPSSGFLTRLGTGLLSEQEIATRLLRLVPGASPEGALNYAPALQPPPPPATTAAEQ